MKSTNQISIVLSFALLSASAVFALASDMPPPPPGSASPAAKAPAPAPAPTEAPVINAAPKLDKINTSMPQSDTFKNVPKEDMPPAPPGSAVQATSEPVQPSAKLVEPKVAELKVDENKSSEAKPATAQTALAAPPAPPSSMPPAPPSTPSVVPSVVPAIAALQNQAKPVDANATALASTSQKDANLTATKEVMANGNGAQDILKPGVELISTTFGNDEIIDIDENESLKKKPDEIVTINFQDLEISDFVKMVSRILGKNILLTQPIAGKVDFITNGPVYKNALPNILLNVLEAKGFSIVANDDFLQIVRNSDASKYNLPYKTDKQNVGQMVNEVVKVYSENVDIVAGKVRQFLTNAGKLITIRESNTMLLTDYPENIKTVKKIIKAIELKNSQEIGFIKLQNTKVSQIAPNLTRIIQTSINQRIDTEKVELIPDATTNSFIIISNKKNVATVQKIIEKLDEKDNATEQHVYVIPLKNSDAKQMLGPVSGVINTRQYIPPAVKPAVSVDDQTNSIIIVGTKGDYDDVSDLLATLDQEKQQVYIVARIMEISDSKAHDIGIKYGIEGGKSNSNGLFTFAANLGGPTVAISSALSSYITTGNISQGVALGAAITLLKNEGAANVVSEPTLLCLDNKESSIFVGETVSILTAAVQGASSTDLARNNYSRESIGLTLKVKPRISNDKKVNLVLEANLEDIKPGSANDGKPNTTKRLVKTEIVVNNGETAIIGGLVKDSKSSTSNKIPLLGDIPLLGRAFREDVDNSDKTNLVIVLTPYVVTKSTDLAFLRDRLTELSKIQASFDKEVDEKLHHKK